MMFYQIIGSLFILWSIIDYGRQESVFPSRWGVAKFTYRDDDWVFNLVIVLRFFVGLYFCIKGLGWVD